MDHADIHSFENQELHELATRGDNDAVRRALGAGADVNALDGIGRTALTCAVAGDNWQNVDASFMTAGRLDVLRTLLGHRDVSLYTLNAPQSALQGATTLGMAAWLNMPEAVQVLLDASMGAVSVDGMDCHGATALMYAARDDNLEVVQQLLSRGARPDFRDANHRTPIQYALTHPHILWLCEGVLRRHRWLQIKNPSKSKVFSNPRRLLELSTASLPVPDVSNLPPWTLLTKVETSRLTDDLIQAVISANVILLHSLLFPPPPPSLASSTLHPMSAPILVNCLDATGHSPIHYCASAVVPSIDVLDALYCVGADVSLFTDFEHYTPLHCLARAVHSKDSAVALYDFTVHLIRDLHAPLSALDKHDETCLHIAAEHGSCIDLLLALLHCDATGSVRGLRNVRGLTALDVAKPEFRTAFDMDAEKLRSPSSLSVLTIRPATSCISITSCAGQKSTLRVSDASSISSDVDITTLCHQLLTNLRLTSPSVRHHSYSASLSHLDSVLRDASKIGHSVIRILRGRVDDLKKELRGTQYLCTQVNNLLVTVETAAVAQLHARGLESIHPRRRNRGSEDSQATAVSSDLAVTHEIKELLIGKQKMNAGVSPLFYRHSSTPNLFESRLDGTPSPWPACVDGATPRGDSMAYRAHLANLLDIDRDLGKQQVMSSGDSLSGSSWSPNVKHLLKRKKREEAWIHVLEDEKSVVTVCADVQGNREKPLGGTSKLKAWLKKIVPDRPLKLERPRNIGIAGYFPRYEARYAVPEADDVKDRPDTLNVLIDHVLRTSNVVLAAASRDLVCITECMAATDLLITSSMDYISRAERIFQRAMKTRETAIVNLRQRSHKSVCDGRRSVRRMDLPDLPHSQYVSAQPSPSSSRPNTADSITSTLSSLSSTLIEDDDEETRALRRLFLRKIDARIDGAQDEAEKVHGWLRIVKEALRGVKRRAYI